MIQIDHVTRRFGRAVAVDDVSLKVESGESVALWGANGAGKTTLIRCVLGLLRRRGRITIGGHEVRRRGKAARMLVGYVPQELGFYDELRAEEAIRFFARLKGLRRVEGAEELARVGLEGHGRKRIRELSGGMKQRLALAVALLGDPPVLILDEVTASLDAVGREEFVGLLEGLSGAGRTMLFASHRVDEVSALADRVVMLDKGRVAEVLAGGAFVARMRGGAVLHVHIPAEHRDRAMRALRESGFDPRLNGVGLLVPVAHDQKAGPLRALAQSGAPFSDFEVLSPGRAARGKTRNSEATS